MTHLYYFTYIGILVLKVNNLNTPELLFNKKKGLEKKVPN